jgi:hypothetical protein
MSSAQTDDQLRAQLADAFGAFRDALQATLQVQAQRSIDAEIERLGREQAGTDFRVLNATVSVQVQDVTVASSVPAARPRPRPAAQSRARRRRSGGKPAAASGPAASRRRGAVADAVIAAFSGASELTVGQLHEHLEASGVESTVNNLHQQLRRLVSAGILERAGRGVYRRAQ